MECYFDVRITPAKFPIMHKFSLHILYPLLMYYTEHSLFSRVKNILPKLWATRWHSRLDMFDVCYLLALDCSAFGVRLNEPNISNGNVGLVVFSS